MVARMSVAVTLAVACSLAGGCGGDDAPEGSGGSSVTATGGGGQGGTSGGGQGGTPGGGQGGGAGGSGAGGAAGDTWNSFAMGFMAAYCVECHTAGDPQGRDYTLYAEVVEEAGTIRCGVTPVALPDCTGFPPPGQFPVGNGAMPSESERQRLVDWIDAGLPE